MEFATTDSAFNVVIKCVALSTRTYVDVIDDVVSYVRVDEDDAVVRQYTHHHQLPCHDHSMFAPLPIWFSLRVATIIINATIVCH